jgi:AcrR family transcriptional regulator
VHRGDGGISTKEYLNDISFFNFSIWNFYNTKLLYIVIITIGFIITGYNVAICSGEMTMSLADWKEREKEQRRNDIIDVAMKLFYSEGYDNVSMSDIAAKVGLKKPTLYLYFKNKESLFFAIVIRGSMIRNPMVRKEADKYKAGQEKLGAVTRALGQFNAKYPEYNWADYFFRSGKFNLEDLENEDIKKILDLQREMFDTISGCIKSGMDDGTYLPDVDPLGVAVFITMVIEGTFNLRPDFKYVLECGGVDKAKFAMDTARLTRRAIMNEDKANRNNP